jgi:SAM-dependent methyltransferase
VRIRELYESLYTPSHTSIVVPTVEAFKRYRTLKRMWHWICGDYRDEVLKKAHGKVLYVGCGNGHLLVPLREKGCQTYGIETNRKSVDACRKKGFDVTAATLQDAQFRDEFFDLVILSQVLEHVPSPVETLCEVARILKPRGSVLIYCPNVDSYVAGCFGRYWHGWHVPFHFYAFTGPTIQELVDRSGLTVVALNSVTPEYFFRVSLKSRLWGDNDTVTRPMKRGWALDNLVARAGVSGLLRVLDTVLLGKGDCLKVEAVKGSHENYES